MRMARVREAFRVSESLLMRRQLFKRGGLSSGENFGVVGVIRVVVEGKGRM